MDSALTEACREKIFKTYELAEKIYQRTFPRPNIWFDLEQLRVAGTATLQKNLIRLNPFYLQSERQNFIDRTPGHEAVHLIAHQLFPRMKQSHGPEWKGVAVRLGVAPTRCHTYDSAPVADKLGIVTHSYVCVMCERKFNFTDLVHRRHRNGSRIMGCSKGHPWSPVVEKGAGVPTVIESKEVTIQKFIDSYMPTKTEMSTPKTHGAYRPF